MLTNHNVQKHNQEWMAKRHEDSLEREKELISIVVMISQAYISLKFY